MQTVGAVVVQSLENQQPRRRPVVVAIAAGTVWGLWCGMANGWTVASTIAQMAVPWIWLAAVVAYRGAASTRTAAWLGATALTAANVGYLLVGSIGRTVAGLPVGGGIRFFLLWTTIGLVAGAVAGVLGRWLTVERSMVVASVALATVSVAEPLALWAHIDHTDAHVAYAAIAAGGAALPVALLRSARERTVAAILGVLVLTYPTAVAVEAILIALGQISAPLRLL